MPVDGDKTKSKWILYGADGKYLVGDFDGRKFTATSGKHQTWHGDFYAAQTFTNAPDGRCIQVGWGRDCVFPGMPFNQQMTVPCELTLRTTSEGARLFVEPAAELFTLRKNLVAAAENIDLEEGKNLLGGEEAELIDVAAEIDIGKAQRIELTLRGTAIVYEAASRTIACGRHVAPLVLDDGRLKLRALVDRGSVELFASGGRVAISTAHRPKAEDRSMSLVARGGAARVRSLDVRELAPAWTPVGTAK
jgi:sucrose-6-phosphate hydrolase SacC (GH32 family)